MKMGKSEKDSVSPPASYDETCMEILNRLDELKGLAIEAGDEILVDGLNYAFETFLTRYCDSKHADLNIRMRRHFQPPKAYMN